MPSILGLATAVPKYIHRQESIALQIAEKMGLPEEKWEKLVRIFGRSKIEQRYAVVPSFKDGLYAPDAAPTTFERNELYKSEAPDLSERAARAAIEDWGEDPKEITHVIAVSCTGIMAPGIEFLLVDRLGLDRGVDRIGLNFMGCFGAFRGLSVAKALAAADPKNRVLLVCTELCSLHCQYNQTSENFVANALFADGSGSAIIGQDEGHWRLVNQRQLAIEDSLDEMTWTAGDTGFLMRLTPQVPKRIGEEIVPYTTALLGGRTTFHECDWAVHPGGKAVLEKVEKACELGEDQLDASWHTLANYGNVSSATLLFILRRLLDKKASNEWTVGLGFGPGLSIEGLLLQRGEKR